MKNSEISTIINQFDNYFELNLEDIIKDGTKTSPKIDVLLYSPTRKFKFWKLITLGASDFSMPKVKNGGAKTREFVMFVDSEVRFFINNNESKWFFTFLKNVAKTIKTNKLSLSFYDVFEVNFDDSQSCFATFIPIKLLEGKTLRNKLSAFKDCEFVQLMPLDKDQAKQVARFGERWCMQNFYPEISEGNEFFARMPKDFIWKTEEE